jgi:8-oxo-dGTP pyrophosphatase MutT (NUDIX family)
MAEIPPVSNQPIVADAVGQRQFACAPCAVAAFIVDERERLLLLSCPDKRGAPGKWEVVNGALEAGETLLQGVLREVREEAGPQIRVRPLGVIHAYTFRYDESIQHMNAVCFLLAYEGGEVVPGDDMAGSEVRWTSLDELESGVVEILIPSFYPWLPRHAIEMYRLLKDRPPAELQAALRT